MYKTVKIDKKALLRNFLLNNFSKFRYEQLTGSPLEFPEYDLTARKYLQFAEYELLEMKNHSNKLEHIHLINCVSHLKRAIDCQLDTCLYILKLLKIFKRKNLGLNSKLDFFKQAGVFNSFSLDRFNKVRNKMEHDYQIPKIEDIEAYFDLVSAFVSVLESMIMSLRIASEICLTHEELEKETATFFEIYYDFMDSPEISYRISKNEKIYAAPRSKYTREEAFVTVTPEDREEFPYFLKVLLLLIRQDSFVNDKYILQNI
ncbi:hypothetical protein [Priestia megaterium]|uniref:hypothetical protein n=1 Tax=Priestia megaterium TaxID=1404 RepID=UPI0025A36B66|nr:hypothetical protein [Priestia megaterium]MDM8151657.1 hypothetical protein [Priestia megaterium]